jgi:zinc/manganese transport system ATP-binding protein
MVNAGRWTTSPSATGAIRHCNHISGHFAVGSLTAVVGPNGAGKSTLCKSIMGCCPASGGHVTTATPRARIAYLPQLAELDRGFPDGCVRRRAARLLACAGRVGRRQ